MMGANHLQPLWLVSAAPMSAPPPDVLLNADEETRRAVMLAVQDGIRTATSNGRSIPTPDALLTAIVEALCGREGELRNATDLGNRIRGEG